MFMAVSFNKKKHIFLLDMKNVTIDIDVSRRRKKTDM